MHVASSLTLPDELELARTQGELVVFAGAGVSVGPPSLLPDFHTLARKIADPPQPLLANEPALDKYLGRAEREHRVDVQERARSILGAANGGHAPLHEYLVGLFESAEKVRLITTNLDLHFTTAAAALFGPERVPHYVGPALPPGRDFRGIVQLHGSLSQKQDQLVLTDSNFGAAYMAEGWAARFLVGVFAERTILFVGYSLADPLMQYLMPALRPTNRWYALCREDDRATWDSKGIVPVTFALRTVGDQFGDLNDGMKRWHWYVHAPPSDHDHELRRIIALGPPSSPVDADYVRARLNTEAGFSTFWNAATDVAWFDWAAGEGMLDKLFEESADSHVVVRWSDWVLRRFSEGDQPPLLSFIRSKSLRLHSRFAFEIALHLARTDPLPPRPVLRQLITLLMNQPAGISSAFDHHLWLLEKLMRGGLADEALGLLSWMTRVHLEPIERFRAQFEETRERPAELPSLTNRIAMTSVAGDLARSLEDHGATLAESSSALLAELGVLRLREAYRLLALARGDADQIDWLSYGRTAIAPSNQDQFGGAEDVFVLLVRTALDHWRSHAPDQLSVFGSTHSRAPELLLRRLALHAFAGCPGSRADEILARALAEGWARVFWLRPELYGVLKAHYAAASETARESFVVALRDDAWWGEQFDEHQHHARFSLSSLLIRLCPTSQITREFALSEQSSHPEWQEQDTDGFLSRMHVGTRGDEPSPISAEQMVQWPPSDAYSRIHDELASAGERGHSLLGALQQAMKRDPHWGVELFLAAADASPANTHMLDASVWGIRDADCTEPDREVFLERVAGWEWPIEVTDALGRLIDHWGNSLGTEPAHSLLDKLSIAADRVYDRSRDIAVSEIGSLGWTERAMNHPAGNAAFTWWRVASARNRAGGPSVLNVDDDERRRWKRVADDTTSAGAGARPVLGMATDRIGAADYPWAVEHVFSLFDPALGRDRAAQLWDGRLMQSHWSWTTVAALRPFLSAFLSASATLVPARSRQLGDWIGLLLAHSAESAFSLASLHVFIQHASIDAREAFAAGLPRHLDGLSPEGRIALWQETLQPYWRDRRTNVPVPLSNGEIVALLEWILSLPEVAADALTELESTHGDQFEHAERVVWSWRDDPAWIEAHPDDAVRLIRWLTNRRSMPTWSAADAASHLETAFSAGAERSLVIAAAEALGGLPCPEAIALAERLRRLST